RAKAKIEYMLREDPQRPTATPSDAEMYRIMSSFTPTQDFYSFGDEQRLILRADLNDPDNTISPNDNPQAALLIGTPARENEALNTAWRYPVDTNNDGNFDTVTLYGIYFRTPKLIAGQPARARKPLDARTPPMQAGNLNPACTQAEGTVASLVGDSGWERITGRLQKSFFVYTVNVPITAQDIAAGGLPPNSQPFTGTTSISALEYQQDQSRIPLSNNAVVYEDDLDISPGPPLNLNGRILTNSNFLVSGLGGARNIRLFQVSSKQSCFYDAENSKIVVAGNVVNGWSGSDAPRNAVEVHLFKSTTDPDQPNTGAPAISATDQSVEENSLRVLYNNDAYSRRLNALVEEQAAKSPATDPDFVTLAMQPPKSQTRTQALEDYFKERLRKVPFNEPLEVIDPDTDYTVQDSGNNNSLRPIDRWSFPTTPPTFNGTTEVSSVNGPTNLRILPTQLASRDPRSIESGASEENLGERVVVGNNLPAQRWNGTKFTSGEQQVDNVPTPWTGGDAPRTRASQVTKLADVGATDRGNGTGETPPATTAPNPPYRDGFWEKVAAEIPRTDLDGVGGLRVITSAGVYDRTNSFLPPPSWIDTVTGTLKSGPASIGTAPAANNTYDDPETPAATATEQYPVVWPDSMPMSPLGPGSRVWNNGSVAAGTIAPGTWGTWDPTWSTQVQAAPALPDATALPPAENNTNFVAERATTSKFARGDLRMRASAVYHYAITNGGYDPIALAATPGTQPTQVPLACVSSYYDPSNAFTARNITTGPGLSNDASLDVSGEPAIGTRQAIIGSNNGITYGPPLRGQSITTATSNPPNAQGLLTGGDAILEAQANLVFPDGRFANGPLRTALQVPGNQRTLAQQAAIDSTNCALDILSGAIAPAPALIPHGAIQEVAFLNGREVKAIDRDNPGGVNETFSLSSPLPGTTGAATLTGNYDQPLEEREPLEIRATQLDINRLRGFNIAGPNTTAPTEWLLPNSGIIYASRDDALPDRSARSAVPDQTKRESPTDYRLDPTRKPNGILLINGQQLFRGGTTPTPPTSVNDVVREKGLTLVSNLPAYLKGEFNPHGNNPPAAPGTTPAFTPVEEFVTRVAPDWSNFYGRNLPLNPNFACRAGDPRLPNCGGDFWRPATVLADSLTLLSRSYRFGFRNEGDFDLRNNAGAAAVWPRRQQGFFNNNFVTNGLSSGAFSNNGTLVGLPGAGAPLTDGDYVAAPPVTPPQFLWSSYFNNFVTPVQRRGNFPEYVMEVCPKLPVAACEDDDWFIDLTGGATTPKAENVTLNVTPYPAPNPADPSLLRAGSTFAPPATSLQRFPRRVAFARTPAVPPATSPPLSNLPSPQPLGIRGGLISATADSRDGSLWFAGSAGGAVSFDNTSPPYVVNPDTTPPGTTTDGANVPVPPLAAASLPNNAAIGSAANPAPIPLTPTPPFNGSQPLLLPVPQIQTLSAATPPPGGNQMPRGTSFARQTSWIPQAVNTTFNLIVGAGDTPSRRLNATIGDFNGGLQNLPRFLESWNNGDSATNIRGSFIQQGRSAFSTAPYQPIQLPATASLASLFEIRGPGAPNPFPTPGSIRNTYNTDAGNQRIPYFSPPGRNWGFDVGLLSQPPDLFTQRFTTPSTRTQPAEYFREVARNDDWVKTLMCAELANSPGTKALSSPNLPSDCPPT
ncbi:hormogonium polysaccharide biosynthesis protein HpsA, partial [Microcoleus sp. herbarium19]